MPCPPLSTIATAAPVDAAELLLALTCEALLAYGEALAVNNVTSPLASRRWPDLSPTPEKGLYA